MLASGIGIGDEVIVPSFSFAATANAVALTGAKVVFADICRDDFNIDPQHVESLISSRTKAIVAVHLYGHPARMSELSTLCNKAGLLLIEDAAQALGARYHDRPIGSLSHFGALSFYATKNISSGEGGMIATNELEVSRRARLLRNQGQELKYRNEVIGYNNRLSDIHAAIGRQQLRQLTKWQSARESNAKFLSANLRGLEVPIVRPGMAHSFHQYTIRVAERHREKLIEHLAKCGVQSGVYYPTPIHQLPCFASTPTSPAQQVVLPETEAAAREVLSIPVHPSLTKRQLNRVVDAVNSYGPTR
jgi:dTDP-4-amino-4,6-dideoxygalactose transaminase